MAVQDVHGRPNGCMGKQDAGDADVDGPPGILHQKVARAEAVFGHQGKAIAIQGSSTTRAMLLAMIQDHHQKQITQMEVTNKADMDAMMEMMNSLVASNKETTCPGGNKKNTSTGKHERNPRKKLTL